jgi:hypothetical protein
MTTQEIQERNKQIALMLGAIYSSHADAWGFGNARIEPNELKFGNEIFKGCVWAERFEKELKFHSDWNWLMEAVSFVQRLPLDEKTHRIYNMPLRTSQKDVFIAVSDFAKHYNEGKL